MEKGKEKKVTYLFVLLAACLLVVPSVAGTVEIKEIQFSFIGLPYYSQQTLGFSQAAEFDGSVAIPTGSDTVDYGAYTISGAVVTLSSTALSDGYDTSTGTFDGPITLTITGTLYDVQTLTAITGNVVLLEASMDSDSLVMEEVFTNFASGSALFTTTGGALYLGNGGVVNGDEVLYLDDFGMGLWGSGVTVLFGDDSMTPYNASLQITTNAIPEPATLGLLSIGTIFLARKRKNV